MRKSALLLVGVLAVFIFLAVMMMQSLVIMQRIASVSDVSGDVQVSSNTESTFRQLLADDHVAAGYTVRTGPDSRVTLNWMDGSRVRLGESTAMRVRKCSLNTATDTTTALFDLDVGRVWVRVLSALGGKTKFQIRTPTATAGVRGTVFSVGVEPEGRTEVSVYEGTVHVSGASGAADVAAGRQAVAAQQSPLSVRERESDIDWQEQTGIIGPRLDLDQGLQAQVTAGQETVTISGVAEPEARVTIDGSPVELDRHNRFLARVPITDAQDGVIVVSASDSRGGRTDRAVTITRER